MDETSPIIVYSDVYGQNMKSYVDYIFVNSVAKNKLWDYVICQTIINNIEDETDFIDIGANIGLITLGLNKLNTNNKKINIYCYECDPETFICLAFNIKQSLRENIKIYNFALSDKIELCNMTTNTYNRGSNMIIRRNDEMTNSNMYNSYKDKHKINENIYIPAFPLDDLIYTFKKRVSVIKIDVEGSEHNILMGSKKFIELHKPKIIIEIMPLNYNSVDSLLRSYNYILLEYIGDENYLYIWNY